MLVSLYVSNFAIIDNIQVDFKDKMSVLTGETGAGKSLIIDAIGLLFGKRASSDLVRFGEVKATIEGIFDSWSPLVAEILGQDLSDEEYLIIKREISSNGKSICKINNQTVSLANLSMVAETIGDIHSQFDTQGLFNQNNYLGFIDDEETNALINNYSNELKNYNKLSSELKKLLKQNEDKDQKLDFLKYQYRELENAELSLSEEEDLINRSNYLLNFGIISENINGIISLFNDNNILDNIYESLGNLSKLEKFDLKYLNLKKQIEESYYNLSDAIEEVNHEFKNLDFDVTELDNINKRLAVYSDLKRKYKKSTTEIIEMHNNLKSEISNIENYDFIIKDLEKLVKIAFDKTLTIGKNIREKRIINSKTLKEKVLENLTDLMLKNVKFEIDFNNLDVINFYKNGLDIVDFLVSFNIGEPIKPLSKVASGGELSRFMLALKTIVSDKLNLQLIIFDEIDNGVSGVIAYSIASKIKAISKKCQVICVTHLPQVAAISNQHYRISKLIDENARTSTEMKELVYEERVIEVAKMISNGEVTTASKNLAIELLKA